MLWNLRIRILQILAQFGYYDSKDLPISIFDIRSQIWVDWFSYEKLCLNFAEKLTFGLSVRALPNKDIR